MTNTMRAARFFIFNAILATAIAGADEVPPPQVEFLNPPEYDSYAVDSDGEFDSKSVLLEEPVAPQKKYLLNEEVLQLWDACPAPVESTGTWLRRGWWYAEIDAVVLIRKWDRQNALLAGDGATIFQDNTGRIRFARDVNLGRTDAPAASGRLNLGRFLFRDIDNRDHTLEFSAMGGNQFFKECLLESVNPNQIVTSPGLSRLGAPNFDGASSTYVQYASRLNNFEWNYKVTSRMKRDRMELQPNGEWIRRAQHTVTYHGLAGMRYLDLTENVYWTAEDIINVDDAGNVFTGENGYFNSHTSNDVFGFQAGAGASIEFDRFSITSHFRGGVMFNDAKMSGNLTYTDPTSGVARTDVGFSRDARDGSLPLILQGGVMGRYHLRPNVSIRAGYEFLYLTAMALAPHNLEFTGETLKVGRSATPFYHGLTLGGEFYW